MFLVFKTEKNLRSKNREAYLVTVLVVLENSEGGALYLTWNCRVVKNLIHHLSYRKQLQQY